ncbi:N-acetylneuraminate synthase [Legionella fallonii]|uniref:N,N'-diacetyllegionaminic acid synthase n=1 Tax=Legionella fallonii LLAP-10 TaxID=1212491 RepID=A0A098G2N4_9GAMM|nr:N-acetylneuraminate synthase [Legionella fallonii]CEG56246.1 N,N'-diacetyllegionaminic acid synthase [Legionella fallonii LLAP-10]
MNKLKDSVYFIAEAGVNHNGNKDLALKLIDAAVEAGADAVKFQTFKASKLASQSVAKAKYQKANTDADESQLDMLIKLELPEDWHFELQEHAQKRGIEFLSTAFDETSLHLLQTLNLPCYKVPSGELTNAPLLWRFAKIGKPLIISTGMATMAEVEEGLAIVTHALHSSKEPCGMDEVWQLWSKQEARERLKECVTLLHCTSQYPTPWHEVNLKAMNTLSAAFGLEVGYSDHTEGTVIPLAAVALGAKIIEKHFTLDKTLPGPDHKASIEVDELKKLISEIRALELALGNGVKAPQPSEWDTRRVARQAIVVANSLPEGKVIERNDLTTARTGEGLAPKLIWELVGSISKKAYEPGDVF